ncbi:MAG TPA: hypothetical protein VIF09_26600 [Polyangiaceae bacterium]|jgi:hypothetical protein
MRRSIVAACVFGSVLVTALVATWRDGTPRFEGSDAHAAQRVEARGARVEAPVEVPRVEPEAPPPAPPRPVKIAPRKAPPRASAELIIIEPVEGDEPPPLPPAPLTMDDLFPPLPQTGGKAPCFDKLQGIGGMSPCPGSTPRGGP